MLREALALSLSDTKPAPEPSSPTTLPAPPTPSPPAPVPKVVVLNVVVKVRMDKNWTSIAKINIFPSNGASSDTSAPDLYPFFHDATNLTHQCNPLRSSLRSSQMLQSMPATKADDEVVSSILRAGSKIMSDVDNPAPPPAAADSSAGDDDAPTEPGPDPAASSAPVKSSRPSSPTSSVDSADEDYTDALTRKGFVRKAKAREEALMMEEKRR